MPRRNPDGSFTSNGITLDTGVTTEMGEDAAEAIGLVNRLTEEEGLRDEAGALAERIASRAPVAVQLHKVMIDAACESSLDAALNFETEALVQTAMTRDNLEGTRAFFEKREPEFTGE